MNVRRLRDCFDGEVFRAPFMQQIFYVFQPNWRLRLHRAPLSPARRRQHFQCQSLDCQRRQSVFVQELPIEPSGQANQRSGFSLNTNIP